MSRKAVCTRCFVAQREYDRGMVASDSSKRGFGSQPALGSKGEMDMDRLTATPNSRTTARALSALAVAIGAMLIAAAPAKADHGDFGFFFSAPFPFPFPAPVVVEHEVVYERPQAVYERP